MQVLSYYKQQGSLFCSMAVDIGAVAGSVLVVEPLISAFQEKRQVLSYYKQHGTFLCSQVAGIGAVAGSVYVAAGAFFGYDLLYPATITGFCLCTWAGTTLSQTTEQKILNQEFRSNLLDYLPQGVRKFLDTPSKWVEFKEWPPILDNRELPHPDGIWGLVKNIFSPPPRGLIKVSAFTNGIGLRCLTLNTLTQAKRIADIGLDRPLEEMIKLLKNCFVTLEDDGSAVFSQSYHNFSNSKGEIHLLLRKHDLVWNIYDHDSKTVVSKRKNSFSYRCSEDAKTFCKNAKNGSFIDEINFAKTFALYKYDPSMVELEPIHQSSSFNEEVLISRFMWAVTLIRYQGPSGNHAEIVIEGINDGFFPHNIAAIGKYFVYLAHLVGDKKRKVTQFSSPEKTVKVRDIQTAVKTKFNLKFHERSRIWKHSSDRVKDMINEIEIEKENPPEGFSILGRYSMLTSSQQDSCITWAINKLSMLGITLEKTPYSYIFTDTSHYTKFKPGQKDPQLDTLFFFITHNSKLI